MTRKSGHLRPPLAEQILLGHAIPRLSLAARWRSVQGDAHAGSLIPVVHDGPVVQPCCRGVGEFLVRAGLRIAVDPHRAIALHPREPRQAKMILRLPERCFDGLGRGPLYIPAIPANRTNDASIVPSPQRAQRREQQAQGGERQCDSECGLDFAIWRGDSFGWPLLGCRRPRRTRRKRPVCWRRSARWVCR